MEIALAFILKTIVLTFILYGVYKVGHFVGGYQQAKVSLSVFTIYLEKFHGEKITIQELGKRILLIFSNEKVNK